MGPRRDRVVQWGKITGCLLLTLLSLRLHPFSTSVADVTTTGPANANRNTEQPQRLRTIQHLVERTRKAWKEVKQATQEVWEKARQKSREIWRRSQQDPEELRRKALEEIQIVWTKAQKEVQELFQRAQQEVEELWEKAQQEAQRHEKRDLSKGNEQADKKRVTQNDALVLVVPGTDARVPFTNIGANPDWLKDNIETILNDRETRHVVANFNYEQPWFPGLCANKKRDCYRTNVEKLADAMLKQFAECCRDGKVAFKVVAHSYGAAISYDALKKLDQDPEAENIGFRVDRLVTLAPAPLSLYRVVPSNVVVWKNIHGGFGYVDGIGDDNIQVNIPPEPGKFQAILKEKRFKLNADHGAIVNDEQGKEAIRKALAP